MVADFNRKGNRKFFDKKFIFRAVGISFLLAIAFLAFEDFKLYQRKERLTAQINSYQKQIQEIEKSSQTLKEEIANADNPQYLEKIAYEQLGEQKPGEKQIIFIKPQQNPEQPAVQQNLLNTKSWLNWFSRSWAWLKSKF